jgi:hypothetical protein
VLTQELRGTNAFMTTATVSFARYLLDHEAKRPELGVEFCHLMVQLAFAAKIMAREIARAALINRLGLVGTKTRLVTHRRYWMFSRTTQWAEPLPGQVSSPRLFPRRWKNRSVCRAEPMLILSCARIRSSAPLTPMQTGPSVRFSRFIAVENIREATSFAGAALNRWRLVT